MDVSLPPVRSGEYLKFEHFPTAQQCFVFRNWEMIPAARLAQVLETTEETVCTMAQEMGLPPQNVNPKWLTAGYITVIKNNWHLLTYEQLCLLLGWSESRLAYILKEDDFLDVKLGRFKPGCPKLRYQPLTEQQKEETKLLRASVEEGLRSFAPKKLDAFDFDPMFARNITKNAKAPTVPGLRLVYSYCALYGDVFTGDFEQSFPEKLLEAYRSVGVNGIWVQAVLYTLVEFPFDPSLSEGWQARAAGLRALTERLDAYGIKLYLYLNEPRGMQEAFFDTRPELKGAVRNNGTACLCTSVPAVKQYLYNGAAALVRAAPKLGGFLTITASENTTNCYSHFQNGETNCPRCRLRSRGDVVAEVNSLLYEGAASVNPDIQLLAWTWGWKPEEAAEAAARLNPAISMMAVSERGTKKTVGGIETVESDYSISVVGPGEEAKEVWQMAKNAGRPAVAKCQFNNTWECCTAPFLPVFETVYRHVRNLLECGVDGYMLDWTVGGYPSPTFAMLNRLLAQKEDLPSLEQALATVFPADSLSAVLQASHLFSEAFDRYPFHVRNLYRGPQNLGCGNLLYRTKTGFESTMTCFPYDDLENWRAIYPVEVYENQMRLVSEQWAEGLEVLKTLTDAQKSACPALAELCDSAETAYLNFRSSYLQTRFVRIRDGEEEGDLPAVIDEEQKNTVRQAALAAGNPTIGYESANHYFFTRGSLLEKYVNCDDVRRRLRKEEMHI